MWPATRPPSEENIGRWGAAQMWRVFDFDYDCKSLVETFLQQTSVDCGYKTTGKRKVILQATVLTETWKVLCYSPGLPKKSSYSAKSTTKYDPLVQILPSSFGTLKNANKKLKVNFTLAACISPAQANLCRLDSFVVSLQKRRSSDSVRSIIKPQLYSTYK